MDILESLELRWFLPSGSPAIGALKKWFGSVEPEGERVDHYLLNGRHDLGVKARVEIGQPTKLELKYLVGSLGIAELTTGFPGDLQRWTKLSLKVDDPELQRDGKWLAVKKQRFLRKYAASNAQSALNEVPGDERPPIGCNVELTRLEHAVGGVTREDWTFGLEAFGESARLLKVLESTCLAVASGGKTPALAPEWTASYPSWIATQNG